MQIFIINMKIYLAAALLLLLSAPLQANTQFSELFLMESSINTALENRVSQYHSQNLSIDIQQQEEELLKLDKQLSALKGANLENALYWFIKGLNHSNLASHFSTTKQSSLTEQHIQLKDNAYESAIKLDRKDKKLSAAIYNTMKHGLPTSLKIEATQKELKLGGNGSSDSYYWYLHWSNIDQLKKAGRHDEADEAFKQMQKELKNSDMDPNVYGSLTQSIERQTFNKQDKPAAKPPQAKAKPRPEPKKEEPAKSIFDNQFIIIALMIAAILSIAIVTFYELVIKKKKR